MSGSGQGEDAPQPGLTLARGQGIALWRQISQRLERDIATGAHKPGGRLPTEAELASEYRVNRHTVRRAMEELEGRGLVRIEQGRGSFVAEDVVDYRLGPRTRFSENIRRQNREPGGRVLRIVEIAAETGLAEQLGIRRGRPVLVVERMGLADGRPLVLGTHHFPASRFGRMAELLRANPSITAALAACGVPDYRRRVTRITARLPTPEEADLLQQSRNRPVLVAEAVNTDPEGEVVDVTFSRYAAGRAQLVVES
ncbi:phosphonate metabolism transcriptional regulator PhnF [Falsiroseomonas selenitidurans]|uniref:Phosphonate metabolism transcriptional regulator PhnF n=1 Tax=Falsiroseomonas selenitidurans TaxID=2716335 RepID=A0ABX1E2V3_9PROT|nr:phosphonate metabolism transcriptional regulator PhnF [Falsiroseomonas selenitidurans]NKC31501.1 phosphonate metabolism transcriptional regulator PhnF [Falsiroseomonas selenitidurans]